MIMIFEEKKKAYCALKFGSQGRSYFPKFPEKLLIIIIKIILQSYENLLSREFIFVIENIRTTVFIFYLIDNQV